MNDLSFPTPQNQEQQSEENSQNKKSAEGLVSRLGLFTATMLVVGSLLGSGIFKKVAPMTLALQSPSLVLWCWFFAGVMTLLGVLTYAEVAARVAQTGGLYAYLRSMYGKPVGYLFGWSCFAVIQSASIASIAFVFAEAVIRIFPDVFQSHHLKGVAISTILLLTLINYVGVIFGAWVENIFTLLKTVGILGVAILGVLFGKPQVSHWITGQEPVFADPPTGLSLIQVMFTSMLSAFWAYDGWNNVGFIGGEVKNPKRNIPLALILGVTSILAIYLFVNFAYFHALPFDEVLEIARNREQIFAVEMIHRILGSNWALMVSLLIMVSTFGSTNGSILSSARIYYAMARDQVFFSSVGKVHPRFKTPSQALVLQGIWASVLVILGSFDQLTDMLIFASFIFYGLGAFGLFLLRKRQIGSSPFLVPTVIPVVYTLFCLMIVGVTLYQTPLQSGFGLLLIILGLPLYVGFQKRNLKTE